MARILISMPEKFLDRIDKIASLEQRSRSELIREALRSYLKNSNYFDRSKANKNAKLLDELLK